MLSNSLARADHCSRGRKRWTSIISSSARPIVNADGRPVEYVRSLYRGDRFRLTAQLTREGIDTQGEQSAAAVLST
jgi:hypothetical protein